MPSDLVLVAKFGAAHGVRGEVRIKSYTQDPQALLDYSPLATRDGRLFHIESLRPAREVLVARITELKDRNAAEAVTNLDLLVPKDRIPPAEDEDEFLHSDLIDLKAYSVAGDFIGTITAVHDFGAGAMLDVARKARKSVLIPFTKAMVPEVNVAGGRVSVDCPPDYFEDTPRPPEDRD
ncbi:ribosome maturation factor RimM [Phreatobacter aquaticus]|uniref:Ribosome maturation factor RimM n=1 Tax=Phreatobacter aquaticus TaxID=2570229 RepID=A0A4D7QH22_9HYPH|nr:ribosome maturation factor RimM [Phreatobacter aquaticus]QCK84766.1 ribosome maturation factor RimM [Phreatobacter aquaticus]